MCRYDMKSEGIRWIGGIEDKCGVCVKRIHVFHNLLPARLRRTYAVIPILRVSDGNRLISQVAKEDVWPRIVGIFRIAAPGPDNTRGRSRIVVQLPLIVREGWLRSTQNR